MIDNLTIVLIVLGVSWMARRAMLLDRQRPWFTDPPEPTPPGDPSDPTKAPAPGARAVPSWRERARPYQAPAARRR